MQKKSLLVALFCGALCLTGCLKNEESASVAQVRIAKANELNSIAKLNEAKAAAEAVYAQAELTIANAEAKLNAAHVVVEFVGCPFSFLVAHQYLGARRGVLA